MRDVKASAAPPPETIDAVIHTLETTPEVSSLVLGGRYFLNAEWSDSVKKEYIKKLAVLLVANQALKKVSHSNLYHYTESSLQMNAFFSSKIMAALTCLPLQTLSIDFLAVQALLTQVATLKHLQKLSIACKADELHFFVDNWEKIRLPRSLSSITIHVSNTFQYDVANHKMLGIEEISEPICNLIKSALQLKNFCFVFDMTLDVDFFEKLAIILNNGEHNLETIVLKGHVNDAAITKIISILDVNRRLQIICTEGLRDYRLLYGAVEVVNERNMRYRNPHLYSSLLQHELFSGEGLTELGEDYYAGVDATRNNATKDEEEKSPGKVLQKRKLPGKREEPPQERTTSLSSPSMGSLKCSFMPSIKKPDTKKPKPFASSSYTQTF